jgi:uncharacterized protein YdaU (DUF1376 family)
MSADTRPDVWFPLVVGDYLKDTSRLTTEQHGAYLLLLMDYWTKGPPPDDDAALASITKLDARTWRKQRPRLASFFRIVDGVWRHKRVDEELIRWAEKKAKYIERAAAGGRAKAAKSTASSTTKALLKSCSASASREVEAPTGASTLSEQNCFLGPKEVRDAFCAKLGEDWCRTYLDRCAWQDVPERALIPATRYAGTKLVRDARDILAKLNLTVLEKAA